MLDQLDRAFEGLLRARGIDEPIAFETPDSEWGGRISQPTLNVFLWDIRRSLDQASAGRELTAPAPSGTRAWRRRSPRIEFHYLVTAWTTVVVDEHRLLGDALVAILASPVMAPADPLTFVAPDDPPPTLRVARADGKDLADFWGAVDGKLKPGLNVVVTASVDPGLLDGEAGPPTSGLQIDARRLPSGTGSPVDPEALDAVESVNAVGWTHPAAGAEVRSPRGSSRVRTHEGRFGGRRSAFLVRGRPGDLITVTSPDGRVEQFEFPPRDDPSVEEDPEP